LAFVTAHPQWRRGVAPAIFAGPGYLSHWSGALTLGGDPNARPAQPVTRVTWWAARAYCEARGARLPGEAEWELAAQASRTARDASKDPAFLAKILAWYSTPTSTLADAGAGEANLWGVRDLHGLIWEWVEDFQASMITSDNREEGASDISRFCGAGAVSAARKEDYAAFMRTAMRASLRADQATASLGFRCASSIPPRSSHQTRGK
jgi:formylglycine-generating enzyme required for sulfatase activity